MSDRSRIQREAATRFCKGSTWIDYDNDDYPDLFLNNMAGTGLLMHNNQDGAFTNVTARLASRGPDGGFSCGTWDYDNDGWLDIFATCYDRTVEDLDKGLIGEPHHLNSNRLYRNSRSAAFEDKTKEAGLDLVLASMGSNF